MSLISALIGELPYGTGCRASFSKTMKRIINGIMDDPGEGHAFLIGLGDGVAFTKTDWNMIGDWSKPDDIKGELHYYKIGLFVGRVFIIGFVTGMLDILI